MKNSKKGFTLTEVLIVTAIIVILSGAAIAGIAVTVSNAKERGEKIQASQGVNWESEAVLKVKKTKIELGNEQIYEESADTPTPGNAAENTDELNEGSGEGEGEGEGNNSGNNDSNTDNNSNNNSNSNSNNDSNTNDNNNNNGNDSGNNNSGNNSGNNNSSNSSSTVVGFAEATNGYVAYGNNGKLGVVSVTDNGNNSVTVVITDGWDNNNPSNDTCTVTITKNGNSYSMSVDSGNGNWARMATMTEGDWNSGYNYSSNYTLTQNDLNNLENKIGLKLS